MNNLLKNIFHWVGFLLLQIVLLFYFRPTSIYTPYIYLFLLLSVSTKLPRITTLFIAFITGLFIDLLSNSWGIHAFAAVFVIFISHSFVSLFSPQSLNETYQFSPHTMGKLRYTIILFFLLFIYHLLVIFMWNFSFNLFFLNLWKAFFSAIITLFSIWILSILFQSKKVEDNG